MYLIQFQFIIKFSRFLVKDSHVVINFGPLNKGCKTQQADLWIRDKTISYLANKKSKSFNFLDGLTDSIAARCRYPSKPVYNRLEE